MRYALEGSNSGYPLCEDKAWTLQWDYEMSHHECCICGETRHEDAQYKTSQGWMCIECYDEIFLNVADDGSEIPELL